MTRLRWLAAAAFVTAVTAFVPAVLAQTSPTSRTIHASVTDRAGEPVLNMTASDFVVSDGGRRQQITVKPANTPLRVALIVSDGGQGWFQSGAARFVEIVVNYGEIGITGVVMGFETLADYSQNVDALRAGLQQLGRTGFINRPTGPHLIDAIVEVTKGIRREGYRPAIVVMRAGNEARPGIAADVALDALRRSGAVMYVLSARPVSTDPTPLTTSVVLNDGSRESGGRSLDIRDTTMVHEMQRVASELIHRYEITYTLPSGMTPSDRASVTSTRTGVTVQAPSRVSK